MLSTLLEKQLSITPVSQPFFTFNYGDWHPSPPSSYPQANNPSFQSLYLLTWNIDFRAPYPRARMAAALAYLENLLTSIPSTSPVVIFLQEMQEQRLPLQNLSGQSHHQPVDDEQQADDLTQLRSAPWVQERFHLTDIDTAHWDASYGQITLIDRRLAVAQVSRLRLVSEFQRDAIMLDLYVQSHRDKRLRLCNVHLDSTYGSMRPIQWKGLAKQLQDLDAGVVSSVLAGDCNANQPRDKTEPQMNGFKDAYLELGGTEDDEEGITWGYQSVDWKRWGRKRLDKVVFWGDIHVRSLVRIGANVKVEDEKMARDMNDLDELPFVTDHYGLMSELQVTGRFGNNLHPKSLLDPER